jgi:hypothetical protein
MRLAINKHRISSMPAAPPKKPVRFKEITKPQKNVEELELIPAYLQFFIPNPDHNWVEGDPNYSLAQPWPYDFPQTEASDGSVMRKRA